MIIFDKRDKIAIVNKLVTTYEFLPFYYFLALNLKKLLKLKLIYYKKK